MENFKSAFAMRTLTFKLGGERTVGMDGVERGDPYATVIIDIPQDVSNPDGFRRSLRELLKKSVKLSDRFRTFEIDSTAVCQRLDFLNEVFNPGISPLIDIFRRGVIDHFVDDSDDRVKVLQQRFELISGGDYIGHLSSVHLAVVQ